MALCRLLELSQTFRKPNCLHLKDISSLTTGRLGTETFQIPVFEKTVCNRNECTFQPTEAGTFAYKSSALLLR